jgi:hypothetical protein
VLYRIFQAKSCVGYDELSGLLSAVIDSIYNVPTSLKLETIMKSVYNSE